jgi:hypothetical protein
MLWEQNNGMNHEKPRPKPHGLLHEAAFQHCLTSSSKPSQKFLPFRFSDLTTILQDEVFTTVGIYRSVSRRKPNDISKEHIAWIFSSNANNIIY